MKDAERDQLNNYILTLEAEMGGLRATAEALAAEVLSLRSRLDLLLDRAAPVPSADPGGGDVGMAIHLSDGEWRYAKGGAS